MSQSMIHLTFTSDLEMKRCVCMFCAGLGVQLVGDGAQHVGQDDDQGLQQTLAPAPTPVTLTTTLRH